MGTPKNCKSIVGLPQLEECPNGPCAVMDGPCIADTDCIGDNMVCFDDVNMDTCKNMMSPCCRRGTVVQAAINNPDLSTLVSTGS